MARHGRPRKGAFTTGHNCIRISVPGEQRIRVTVPRGWTAQDTFRRWLCDWRTAHPETILPPEWRLYEADAAPSGGVMHFPDAYRARPAAGTIAPPLDAASPTDAAPHLLPAWDETVERYIDACKGGWHPGGPHGHIRRLESLKSVRNGLRRIGRYGNFANVADVTTTGIVDLLRYLESHPNARGQPFCHSTICSWRGYLRTFCQWAAGDGLIDADAIRWRRYARKHRPRQSACTLGDLDRALRVAPWRFKGKRGAPCRPVLVLMRYLGLRRMGIARLPRAAFVLDGEAPHVTIEPYNDKSQRPRELPIDEAAAADLREYFAAWPCEPSDLPFGRRRADGQIVHVGTKEAWRKLLDSCGVPRNIDGTAGLHRCRKAAMSAMFDQAASAAAGGGDSWRVAKDQAGVSAATLDTYLSRASYTQLYAQRLRAPGQRTSPPLQLAFTFTPSGAIVAELREDDGQQTRTRLDPRSEICRRVLHLVDDCRSAGGQAAAQAEDQLPAASPKAWRTGAVRRVRQVRRVSRG